jgi:hypothetical protein
VPASGSSDKKNSQLSASVTDDPSDCYRVPLDLARGSHSGLFDSHAPARSLIRPTSERQEPSPVQSGCFARPSRRRGHWG